MIMLLFFMLIFSQLVAVTIPAAPQPSTGLAAPNVEFDNAPQDIFYDEELPADEEEDIPTGPIKAIPLLANDEIVVTQANQIPTLNDQSSKKNASIYLNFEGAALSSILNYLGEQKKINVLPHKDLEGVKVSLSTRNPMTMHQAWNVLLTLMEVNGFSLIKTPNMYRVVKTEANGQEVLPVYSSYRGMQPENLPNSDLAIRYIYFLKNMKTDTAKGILEKMIDSKGIIANTDLNALIVKDTSLNIKAAFKIIKELDLGGLREAIEIVPLTFTNAEYVKKVFDDLLGSGGEAPQNNIIRFSGIASQRDSTYFSNQTKIIPEPIRNKVILLGTQKNINKVRKFIIENIDIPIESAGSRLHIKELRYIKAQDIQPILTDIIKPPKGANEKSLITEGGHKVFEDVAIAAEQDDDGSSGKRGSGNRLIIAANAEDWRRLEQFIDKLDKPQPQVAIEVMVVNVSLQQIKNLGTQVFNLKGKSPGAGVNMEFLNLDENSMLQQSPPAQPSSPPTFPLYMDTPKGSTDSSTFVSLGKAGTETSPGNIWGLIRATWGITNSQVVSQPYQVVNNNQPCTVKIETSHRAPGDIDKSNTLQILQKYVDVPAATSVNITPCINLAGNIDLTIDINADDFIEGSVANTTKNHVATKTSMATGEVLVIGGLKKSSITEKVYKTPILSEIPILGNLFKSKEKRKEESNLFVFIRPSVMKPQFDGLPDEYTQLKLDYAKYQVMKSDSYVKDRDPIQRFYFQPAHQTIKSKLADAANGILRPIDDFTYGRSRPKSVNLSLDPYFKVTESIEKAKRERLALRAQSKKLTTHQGYRHSA